MMLGLALKDVEDFKGEKWEEVLTVGVGAGRSSLELPRLGPRRLLLCSVLVLSSADPLHPALSSSEQRLECSSEHLHTQWGLNTFSD